MKKSVILIIACMFALMASAQKNSPRGRGQVVPGRPQQMAPLQFVAMSENNRIILYIDGVPYNETPMRQVQVINLRPMPHDIAVRLVRPADRLVHFELMANELSGTFTVQYDQRSGVLSVYPAVGNANSGLGRGVQTGVPIRPVPPTPPVPLMSPTPSAPLDPDIPANAQAVDVFYASDAEVNDVISVLNNTSFDSDKLPIAKNFVRNKGVDASQAIRIARTITFEDGRLQFLIYAYDYCIDPDNYYQTVEVLDFSTNRNKLMEVINSK